MAERFGPYSLVRQIASGGMAEVHLARANSQDGLGRVLALKMVHPQFSEDEEFIDALVEEAKLSVKLDHPAISAIFDLGKIDGRYYLSMEFVDGKDLFQLLVRTSSAGVYLPLDDAAYVGAQMCRGLEYAHSRRDENGQPMHIVHRDVSPQNVLISWRGEVKICDFGIAKAATRSSRTRAGVIKGKFSYMSPEQSWGDPLDARSDVFSAGICLWEAICGEMLYAEKDATALLDRVRKAEIAPASARRTDVPPDLDAILLRALRREPSNRYQSAAELADALDDWRQRFSPDYDPRRLGDLVLRSFPDFEPLREEVAVAAPAGAAFRGAGLDSPPPREQQPGADTRQMTTMAREDFAPDPESSMIFRLSDLGNLEGLLDDDGGAPAPMGDDSTPPPGAGTDTRPSPAAPEATSMLRPDDLLKAAEAAAAAAESDMQPMLPPGALNVSRLEEELRARGIDADAPVAEGLGGATVMMDAKKLARMMTPPPSAGGEDPDTHLGPPLAMAPPPAGAAYANPFEQKTAFLSTDDPAIAAVLQQAKLQHQGMLDDPAVATPAGDANPTVQDIPPQGEGPGPTGPQSLAASAPTPTPQAPAAKPAPAPTVLARQAPIRGDAPRAQPRSEAGIKGVKVSKAQAVSPGSLPETVAAQAAPVVDEPAAAPLPETAAATPTPIQQDPAPAAPTPAAKEAKKAKAKAEAPTAAAADAKDLDAPITPPSAQDKVAAAKAQMAKKKKVGAKKKEEKAKAPGPSKMGRVARGTPARALSPGVILTLAGVLIFGGITLNFILGMFSVAHGGANITSDPTGASITLNGKKLLAKTPHVVKGLPADKSHGLILKLDGFQKHEEEFDVAPDDVSAVHVILDPDPGSLAISSSPKGAQVYVNGERRGRTPVKVEGLPRDLDLPVTLKKKGYEDLQRIHVWGKQHDDLHFALERSRRGRRRR